MEAAAIVFVIAVGVVVVVAVGAVVVGGCNDWHIVGSGGGRLSGEVVW